MPGRYLFPAFVALESRPRHMRLLPTPHPDDPFGIARPVLFLILVVGILGTGVELLLLEHTDGAWQLVPLALIVLAVAVLLWHARARSPASVRTLRWTMALFTASGLVGVLLHYRGNVEFELEMYPGMHGLELFREALMGATPSLAPGTMIQLGLLGFVYAFRYPVTLSS